MTSWQLFISAVLDHRYPIKQKEQEILDLVSNLSLVRFAAEQTKSGARDSGFLYFHVGNLLVRIVQACSANDVPMPNPSLRFSANSIYESVREVSNQGVTRQFYSFAINYVLFITKEFRLDFDHLTKCALSNLKKSIANDQSKGNRVKWKKRFN